MNIFKFVGKDSPLQKIGKVKTEIFYKIIFFSINWLSFQFCVSTRLIIICAFSDFRI